MSTPTIEEAARYFVDEYESQGLYDEMSLEEYVYAELKMCDPATRTVIFGNSTDYDPQKAQEFVMLCMYQYK